GGGPCGVVVSSAPFLAKVRRRWSLTRFRGRTLWRGGQLRAISRQGLPSLVAHPIPGADLVAWWSAPRRFSPRSAAVGRSPDSGGGPCGVVVSSAPFVAKVRRRRTLTRSWR